MTTTKQVPQVVLDLYATREVLEKGNWIKGTSFRAPDSYCVSGAAAKAIFVGWPWEDVAASRTWTDAQRVRHWKVLEVLHRTLGTRCQPWAVEQWNDAVAQNKEEVLKLIDDAIANELNVPQLMEVR